MSTGISSDVQVNQGDSPEQQPLPAGWAELGIAKPGMSTRAIRPALNISQSTVQRGVARSRVPGTMGAVRGLDGKIYPSSRDSAERREELWTTVHALRHNEDLSVRAIRKRLTDVGVPVSVGRVHGLLTQQCNLCVQVNQTDSPEQSVVAAGKRPASSRTVHRIKWDEDRTYCGRPLSDSWVPGAIMRDWVDRLPENNETLVPCERCWPEGVAK